MLTQLCNLHFLSFFLDLLQRGEVGGSMLPPVCRSGANREHGVRRGCEHATVLIISYTFFSLRNKKNATVQKKNVVFAFWPDHTTPENVFFFSFLLKICWNSVVATQAPLSVFFSLFFFFLLWYANNRLRANLPRTPLQLTK